MSKKSESAEQHIKSVKRRTRRKYSAEEKIRIVLEGMRGEHSIAELCRREGIAQSQYYSWSKDFMEAGKKRLAGDTQREARSDEVVEMRREMRDLKEVLEELEALGYDVGMLQIVSFEEGTLFTLLSPSGGFQHHSIAVSEADVAELIFSARDELGLFEPARSVRASLPADDSFQQVSKSDVQGTLKALHDVLMPPEVEAMLEAAGTEHLILNLQGRVRYAPFAALYDGDQYLVEKFDGGISRFTWGDFDYEPAEGLMQKSAGFGMSEASGEFAALPGVRDELKAVFTGEDGKGVLAGTPLLNDGFTREALEAVLEDPPSVLHIASHFDMRPGQDAGNSYLLLGDGSRLTLKEMNASPNLSFEGVDLLVLSACSTARSTEGSGIEVEGLGAIAQLRGADAVMATLWNVADRSTATFMTDFYTNLSAPGMSKADAMRQAQLALIDRDGTRASDDKPDYSHPYYWAPYILMGNWK